MTKKLIVFDIECLPNVFIVCLKTKNTTLIFEISERKNEFKELMDIFLSNNYIFIGVNCSNYDTLIINALLINYNNLINKDYLFITRFCKKLSDAIIEKNFQAIPNYSKLTYANFFTQIDLMTLMFSKDLRVGLKSLQITMCYDNVEEYLIDWNKPLLTSEIDYLISYCLNDVDSTYKLATLLKSEIDFRRKVNTKYNINCLSKDGVGIGVDIFTKYICEDLNIEPKELFNLVNVDKKINISDLIQPEINFKTKEFNKILDWYRNIKLDLDVYETLTDKEKEEYYQNTVFFNKLSHAYGFGGMHSQNKPCIITSSDKFFISDQDVESFYPLLSIVYGFAPKGFKESFIKVMSFLKESRVKAKIEKDNLTNQLFKLALNSILGNLKNKYSPFYDPAANLAICINGQLFLSMLIERCELEGIECISSNTDGATFKVPVEKSEQYYEICKQWCIDTKMKLEETLYEKLVIHAVNDYIGFKKGYFENKDKIEFFTPQETINFNFVDLLLSDNEKYAIKNKYVKEKGLFITYPRLGKGLEFLIVSKALQNYYGKNIPVEKTIKDFKSIHDYVKTEKVGKQFNVVWNDRPQQHINRFYIKKNAPYLYKWKWTEKKLKGQEIKIKSFTNLLKESGVELVNDLRKIDKFDIDYDFYIKQAYKIINVLEPAQLSLF